MIGERIRHARLAAGFTQDEVIARLLDVGEELTKAGLSKYELGKSTPKANLVLKLSKVLGVPVDYILQESELSLEWDRYRKKSALPAKKRDQFEAQAHHLVENYIRLQEALFPSLEPVQLQTYNVTTVEEAEQAAAALRNQWGMGLQPIESVSQLLEGKGFLLISIADDEVHFDGRCGWARTPRGKFPVIVFNERVPADRKRLDLTHELGHLVMRSPQDLPEKTHEKLAFRFAAAFLVPAAVAQAELGSHRTQLDLAELGLLKQKHGLSMSAWIKRAYDVGIIKEELYTLFMRLFSARGWRKKEPYDYKNPNEVSQRMKQLALRAVAERYISPERAEQLCPGSFQEQLKVWEKALHEGVLSPRLLLRLPQEMRNHLLVAAAEAARLDYESDPELDFSVVDDYLEE